MKIKHAIAALIVATVFLIGTPLADATAFTDVEPDAWYAEAAKMLAAQISVTNSHEWEIDESGNVIHARCTICGYSYTKDISDD